MCITRTAVTTALSVALLCLSMQACSGSGSGDEALTLKGPDNSASQPAGGNPGQQPVDQPAEQPSGTTDLEPGNPPGIVPNEQLRAYRADSPYARVLKDCVLIEQEQQSCALNVLPFIGAEAESGIEAIMDRLLVTHDWMGERFERVLREAPADLVPLFRSTTAIVIGSEVRPSFYWVLNGAVQLDPVYLWMSVPEKRTVSIAEDYRSNFGADLKFKAISIATINGNRASSFFSLEDDSVRRFEDLIVPVMSLLYHELGHANDFMPFEQIAGLDTSLSVLDGIVSKQSAWLSPQIDRDQPLIQDEMKSLASVRYRDEAPTEEQKTYLPDYVGSLMGNDGASQFYSYLTTREDVANLLESSMMSFHYGVHENVAFIDNPSAEAGLSCENAIVGWGTNHRVAADLVVPRARWVTERIIGTSPALDEHLNSLAGQETPMTPGISICENLTPAGTAAKRSITSLDLHQATIALQQEQQAIESHVQRLMH